MKHACLVPATHDDDLTGAMSTQLRASGIDLSGPLPDVEDRTFMFLFRCYSYAEIKKHQASAIALAKAHDLKPVDLFFDIEGISA